MSEYRIIDISGWNTNVAYSQLPEYGVKGAILRVTERGNKVDSMFEKHWNGCTQSGLAMGVYKFSYALSVAEIKTEAEVVVKTLNGRKCPLGVWLDLEWNEQQKLSKATMVGMVKAFRDIIVEAGYHFGIYSGSYWWNHVLDYKNLPYDHWLAAYPNNDTGVVVERLRPNKGEVGWQFSSKFKVAGNGYDMSVFDAAYIDSRINGKNKDVKETPAITNEKMITVDDCINKAIEVATAEIGYLEKKSNSQLDSKTANAGSNNYTKYWRDVYPAYQAQPWCACFISWLFMQLFGVETAKKLLKHWPFVYCPTLAGKTTNKTPKVGSIVLFYRNGTYAHTGLVVGVTSNSITTIEGNTSGASGIVANGGGVCRKVYTRSSLSANTKYFMPDYTLVDNVVASTTTSTTLHIGSSGAAVKTLQTNLNKLGYALTMDGEFGILTERAVIDYQKRHGLEADGIVGSKTNASITAELKKLADAEKFPYLAKVTASELNVRKDGNTKSAIVTKLKKGTIVDITKESNGWGYSKNLGGWMSLAYLETAKYPRNAVTLKKGVPFREDCKNTGKVIEKIAQGHTMQITGAVINSVGNVWYKATHNGRKGYVYSKNVHVS